MASGERLPASEGKRKLEEKEEDDEEWIGPMPAEAVKPKKRKGKGKKLGWKSVLHK